VIQIRVLLERPLRLLGLSLVWCFSLPRCSSSSALRAVSTVTLVSILRKSLRSASVLMDLAASRAKASSSFLFITAYPEGWGMISSYTVLSTVPSLADHPSIYEL